jgi:predicted ferric reductase
MAAIVLSRPTKPPDHHRQPFTWADPLGLIGIGLVVAVVGLWLVNQGLASLYSGLDRAVGSLGLLTGLLASILMILQVLMLARIPLVERAWGHDLLARRHKWTGYASFWFMTAHVLAYMIERSLRSGLTTQAMWLLFINDSWMLWATVGTVMIVLVVGTSIRWARRKLRYESWHLLHPYAYLGMAFALPHQIFDGADFHSLASQTFWWGSYALALAVTLAYRVALPIGRSIYHQLLVTGVNRESADVVSVLMTGRHLDRLSTKSGQFFVWRFLGGHGWTRGHPYTISDAPNNTTFRITIQSVGDDSFRAANLQPGIRVMIEGPYGTMTAERRRHPKVLFAAAGVGITPLRALLADTPYEPSEATLIYRYSTEQDAILTDELDHLARDRGVKVIRLPGARRADGSWLPQDATGDDVWTLRELVPDIAERDIFVCGPPLWIASVKRAARAVGAKPDQIHTEDFAW